MVVEHLLIFILFKQRVYVVNDETQHERINRLAKICWIMPLQMQFNPVALDTRVLRVLGIVLKTQAKSESLSIIANSLADASNRENGIDGAELGAVHRSQSLFLSPGRNRVHRLL